MTSVVRSLAGSPDELVAKVARGDHDALAALYDQLAPLVYGVALRVVRDRTQAEDVVQEAFIEIWRHAGRYDRRYASVRSWAATIARRRGIDRVRSEQSHRNRLTHEATLGARAVDDSPAEVAIGRVEQARARRALASLSIDQRTVLELAYFGGLSQREIADHLQLPLGTVKTRVRDSLARLRRVQALA
jgi:RNA polymerase sigma-70 factor (ECF subfamily)